MQLESTHKEISDFLFSLLEHATAGVSAAVCTDNQVLFTFCEGYRQRYPNKQTMLIDTLYDVASLTKVMSTTMLTCRLFEKKELSLTDPIGKFFNYKTQYHDTTILEILTHSGGFIAERKLWNYLESPDDAYKSILNERPLYKRGTDVVYSCFGFIVLGKILENISGLPLNVLAQQEVFTPLNMQNSAYLPLAINTFASTEYDSKTESYCTGIVHDENARFLNGCAGNAGLFTSLRDCILFCQMLLSNGKTFSNNEFLNEKTISMFHTELARNSTERRSLGFKLHSNDYNFEGKKCSAAAYGHTGFTGTSILIDPIQNKAAILLTNRVHPTRENTLLLKMRGIFHDLAWDV